MPRNLSFVPINFEKELIVERVKEAGLRSGKKTLVLLEGVLQYLTPEAAYATLDVVKELTGPGSILVFDYAHASVIRGEGNDFGEARMTEGVNRYGESWQFGLEEADVEPFLRRFGFRPLERSGPKELEKAYFTNKEGRVVARVNGTQSIVKAGRG